jgi:hypothetical protein
MEALISPNENNRIAQVELQSFEIAEPLYWAICPDNCTTEWTYVDGVFNPPVISVPTADENKSTAISLLQATDWTQIPSVSDPSLSNPYLANKLAFDEYRNDVRQYAVYPVAGNITWPTEPIENWVKV